MLTETLMNAGLITATDEIGVYAGQISGVDVQINNNLKRVRASYTAQDAGNTFSAVATSSYENNGSIDTEDLALTAALAQVLMSIPGITLTIEKTPKNLPRFTRAIVARYAATVSKESLEFITMCIETSTLGDEDYDVIIERIKAKHANS